ncbi:MAG: ATP-dependent sacrificial sulfur transferase LarE [Planctomycetes bacterium]|nr:ATP-dependent sacrificial sulfur transferase LarE [Planctomycetota bacterium]
MTEERLAKLERLRDALRATGGCAVAYSGGVDSSLLLAVAHEVLGPRCLAVIATSSTYAEREGRAALQWVRQRGIPHVVIESEELDIPGFRDNPPDRCYHCKRELFTKVRQQAAARGLEHVADGTNADDARDYRPGRRAAGELRVLSPLLEAGLAKADIRAVAREVYHLPMADKPAMACMASRFPYGSAITRDKLRQVEAIEGMLERLGFRTYRARHHGTVLRLELGPDEIPRLAQPETRHGIVEFAKSLGFTYVTLDLEGYRTGSMNATLPPLPEAALAGKES